MSDEISLALLNRFENKVVWNLNTLCNYRCTYCFFPPEVLGREHDAVGRYSVDQICESFDRTAREWLILISGGEPFLYKHFVALAKGLTRNHHIQVTTNLSRPSVYEFGEEVPPDKVMIVSASFHAVDRENRGEKAVQDYIDKYRFLRERGFLVLANYVTYPPLFSRIRDDFDRLRSAGVDNITTLTFRGEFEGRMYPQAYTREQLDTIRDLAVDRELEARVSAGLNFQGTPCQAGFSYFQMDPAGNLNRCCSISESHGNLFEGTYRFDEAPALCPVDVCHDACCGVSAVELANRKSGSHVGVRENPQQRTHPALQAVTSR